MLEPQLLIADEPTRGVDALVRRGVLEILAALRKERGFSALIISSDLSVVTQIAHRSLVMNRGTIVGMGPIDEVLDDPVDPYVKALAASRSGTVPS